MKSHMLLFASYLRIPYRYVIVLYVNDRLVQYRIPYSLFVVVRVGNVGLLCYTAKNGNIRNGMQEVLPYMTFKETLFQCNSCYCPFISSLIAFPSLRL